MPVPISSSTSSVFCDTFHKVSDIPARFMDAMRKDPRSNIILPTADKALMNERRGSFPESNECWLVCYSSGSKPDFILTVTNGPSGKPYPIFLWTPLQAKEIETSFLELRMQKLVLELLKHVNVRRVFSVFALDVVTDAFATCWSRETGIDIVQEPYYHAKFTYCDLNSLTPERRDGSDADSSLRLATLADLSQTGDLCHRFASESEPFVLSKEDARPEAEMYTTNKQLWVYEHKPTTSITCIVAVTRKSSGVAAITKVYTHPRWRGQGYAEKLVRRVTHELLTAGHMQRAVLYVAHNNVPASKVYHRVGYKGLFPAEGSEMPLVESWLELGFNRDRVDLGHW